MSKIGRDMIINNSVWTFQDYKDFMILYNNVRRTHFIVRDIFLLFFRGAFVQHLEASAVIKNIASIFSVPIDRVEKDFANFLNSLKELSSPSKGGKGQASSLSDRNIYSYMAEHQIPFSATIEIDDLCNLNCIHCYRGERERTYWNKKNFEQCLSELHNLGTMHITLTGGEPLLHENIFDFIRVVEKFGFILSLQSNATRKIRELVKSVRNIPLKNIAISLYSVDERIHDSITGVPGSCKKTKKGIEYLVRHNLPVSINCPVMTVNKDTMRETKSFCNQLGIKCNFAFKIIPSALSGKDTYGLNCFSADFLRKCMKDPCLKLYDDILDNIRNSKPEIHYCQTGFRSITFDAQGNMLICNAFRKKCGNLRDHRVAALWKNSEGLHQWRKEISLINSTCLNCKAYPYCEPCPAHQYMLNGETNRIDTLTCTFGHAFYEADQPL